MELRHQGPRTFIYRRRIILARHPALARTDGFSHADLKPAAANVQSMIKLKFGNLFGTTASEGTFPGKQLHEEIMFRILLVTLAACSLSASPALSQAPKQQQKQIQKRESEGEAASQTQRGGLKRDRQISHEIFRNAHNRMRSHHYHNDR